MIPWLHCCQVVYYLLFVVVEWSVRGITGHSALFNHVDGETQKGTDIQSVCRYMLLF